MAMGAISNKRFSRINRRVILISLKIYGNMHYTEVTVQRFVLQIVVYKKPLFQGEQMFFAFVYVVVTTIH